MPLKDFSGLFILSAYVLFVERFLCWYFSENHRTQTSYDDGLIVKLFAFQFVNSYASLYYIAFFRGCKLNPHNLSKLGDFAERIILVYFINQIRRIKQLKNTPV